jgi:hypothetical protein
MSTTLIAPPRSLTFQTIPCEHCKGRGRGSWTLSDDGRCYACSGRGEILSDAGKEALARFSIALGELEVPVDEIEIGDVVQYTAESGYQTWRTVFRTSSCSQAVCLKLRKPGGNDLNGSTEMYVGHGRSVVRRDDDVLAYAVNAALDGEGARFEV